MNFTTDLVQDLQNTLEVVRSSQKKAYIRFCQKPKRWQIIYKKEKGYHLINLFKDLDHYFGEIFLSWNPKRHLLASKIEQLQSVVDHSCFFYQHYTNKISSINQRILLKKKKIRFEQTKVIYQLVEERLQAFIALLQNLQESRVGVYLGLVQNFSNLLTTRLDLSNLFQRFIFQFNLNYLEDRPVPFFSPLEEKKINWDWMCKVQFLTSYHNHINHLLELNKHPNQVRHAIIDFYIEFQNLKQVDESFIHSDNPWLKAFDLIKNHWQDQAIPFIKAGLPLTPFFHSPSRLKEKLAINLGEYEEGSGQNPSSCLNAVSMNEEDLRLALSTLISQNDPFSLKIFPSQIPILFLITQADLMKKLLQRLDILMGNALTEQDYKALLSVLNYFPHTILVLKGPTKWDMSLNSLANRILTSKEQRAVIEALGRLECPNVTDINLHDYSALESKHIVLLPFSFPCLETLNISDLDHLTISANKLIKFENLKELYLSGNKVESVHYLIEACPKLEVLTISNVPLTEKNLLEWAEKQKLSLLRFISLQGTLINSFPKTLDILALFPCLQSFQILASFNIDNQFTTPYFLKRENTNVVKNIFLATSILRYMPSHLLSSKLAKFNDGCLPIFLFRQKETDWKFIPLAIYMWLQIKKRQPDLPMLFSGCSIQAECNVQLKDEDLLLFVSNKSSSKDAFKNLVINLAQCTNLTNKGIQSLLNYSSCIEELNLYGCHQISDAAFADLPYSALKEMNLLNLKGTSITSQTIFKLNEIYPDLQILYDSYLEAKEFSLKRPCPDVTFKWKKGETIQAIVQAHQAILKRVWVYTKFLQKEEENDFIVSIMELPTDAQPTPQDIEKIIEYAYTEHVTDLNLAAALRLGIYGEQWGCLSIAYYCQNWIAFSLTYENIWEVYKEAKKAQNQNLLFYVHQFVHVLCYPDLNVDHAFFIEHAEKIWEIIKAPQPKKPETVQFNMNDIDSIDKGDTTLIIGEKEKPVHRSLLALRSQYFNRLFMNNFTEVNKKTIYLGHSINSTDFDCILDYIYTGKTPKMNMDRTLEILVGARFFNLLGLEQICLTFIKMGINNENVWTVFQYANRYTLSYLDYSCIHYLIDHLFIKGKLQINCLKSIFQYAQDNKKPNLNQLCLDKIDAIIRKKSPDIITYFQLIDFADQFNLIDFGRNCMHKILRRTYRMAEDQQQNGVEFSFLDYIYQDKINDAFIRFLGHAIPNGCIRLPEDCYVFLTAKGKKYLVKIAKNIYRINYSSLSSIE
jgi:hypothetical protein